MGANRDDDHQNDVTQWVNTHYIFFWTIYITQSLRPASGDTRKVKIIQSILSMKCLKGDFNRQELVFWHQDEWTMKCNVSCDVSDIPILMTYENQNGK